MNITVTRAAVALLVAVSAAGCTTAPEVPNPAPESAAVPAAGRPTRTAEPGVGGPGVDEVVVDDVSVVEDPSVVADRVAGLLWAVDTRTDTSTADAARRAGPWMTAAGLEAFTAITSTDAAWADIAAHAGYVVVAVQDLDDVLEVAFPDTATAAVRTRGVTLTPVGPDGWTGPEQYVVATVHLVRAGQGPWLVDVVETTWAAPGAAEFDEGCDHDHDQH